MKMGKFSRRENLVTGLLIITATIKANGNLLNILLNVKIVATD
jgi:hypothetical protein